ncbi:hypothetical protein KC955_00215 [Candidatus Saccharibacteria bacterium]|nr:hypothetical protein [Candidatus Saccharibacteria bacterium]
MQDNANQSPTDTQSPTVSPAVPTPTDNKKLIIGIAAGLGILVLVLIALVVALLGKKPDTQSGTTDSNPSTSQTSNSSSSTPEKKVLLTVPAKIDKLEYVIYEPKQNANNTTIFFSVRNKCSGCEESTYSGDATTYFDSKTDSYLLDENAGKKYATIKDQDDNVLATPSCGGWIKYQQSKECFVAFAKVPSGTTVSWVFGSNRIDGIKIK